MKTRWVLLSLLAFGLILGGTLLFVSFSKPDPKHLANTKNSTQHVILLQRKKIDDFVHTIEEAHQPVVNPGISYVYSDSYKDGYALRVGKILPESPAARADIRVGDVLISVNGVIPRFDGQHIDNYLGGGNPVNQNTTFVIERDGRRTTVSVKNVLLRGDTSQERAMLSWKVRAEGKDRLARLEQKAEVVYQWLASKKAARDKNFLRHKSIDEFFEEERAFRHWYFNQLEVYGDITNLTYPARTK